MPTLRALALAVTGCATVALAAFWILTLPATVPSAALAPHTPDLGNGHTMFEIGGCSSCHASPNVCRSGMRCLHSPLQNV